MNNSTLNFDVKTGLKNIIGRDLITTDDIAVYELVKNSYDAYATLVKITFDKDYITIEDNGKGMSKEDLTNKWFAVAYSAKKNGSEDANLVRESYLQNIKSKRSHAGAKGVGRFSCDKLGNKLVLITSTTNSSKSSTIVINWKDFERNDKQSFNSITVPFFETDKKIDFPNASAHGTIIQIKNLNSTWDRKKIFNLRRSLEKLINPFSKEKDFTIKIEATDNIQASRNQDKNLVINGIIENTILKILDIKTTQIEVILNDTVITTKIIDRGTLIYHIKEPNTYSTIINNLRINLYFLNQSAKTNFTKLMNIESKNYGSVFLFKNDIRIYPYGDVKDDSWQLDSRKQQGYNRYLGTRDLLGEVDLHTNQLDQFKEVSSRNGGLVETKGKQVLFEIFREKALKRLERYVVGVLWGEAFKKRAYFGNIEDAHTYRHGLKNDKHNDNYKDILKNVGSKIDFIHLINTLSNNENITIIDYDKNLIDIVNDKLSQLKPKFIDVLENIVIKTEDDKLKSQVKQIAANFNKIIEEQEKARQQEENERKKRIAAEKKAKQEQQKRIEAEAKRKVAEVKRREAEVKRREAEVKRREAEAKIKETEVKRREAEAKRREAEAKRKEAEAKRKVAEVKRIEAEEREQKRKEQLNQFKSAETIEYKDLRDSNHIIGIYSDTISKRILGMKRFLDKERLPSKKELLDFLSQINLVNEKIGAVSRFTTKANYLKAILATNENIVSFIIAYIEQNYKALHKLNVSYINKHVNFRTTFKPIELTVIIDNILSNSRKKKAKEIIFSFSLKNENLIISIKDIGKRLDKRLNSDIIFEEGITTTKGAGLGLSHVKRIIQQEFNGEIIHNPNYLEGFELKITLKK